MEWVNAFGRGWIGQDAVELWRFYPGGEPPAKVHWADFATVFGRVLPGKSDSRWTFPSVTPTDHRFGFSKACLVISMQETLCSIFGYGRRIYRVPMYVPMSIPCRSTTGGRRRSNSKVLTHVGLRVFTGNLGSIIGLAVE
jgi:hypothetical protein